MPNFPTNPNDFRIPKVSPDFLSRAFRSTGKACVFGRLAIPIVVA